MKNYTTYGNCLRSAMPSLRIMVLVVLAITPADAFTSIHSVVYNKNGNIALRRENPYEVSFRLPAPLSRASDVSINMNLIELHKKFVYAARPDLALFDKLVGAANTTINHFTVETKSNSPTNKFENVLEDIQNDLVKMDDVYTETIELKCILMMKKLQAESIAEEWYNRAEFAVKKGSEETARYALSQRQKLFEAIKMLEERIENQVSIIQKLNDTIQLLEDRYQEVLQKKDELIVRAMSATNVKKANDMLCKKMKTDIKSLVVVDDLETAFKKLEEDASCDKTQYKMMGEKELDQLGREIFQYSYNTIRY